MSPLIDAHNHLHDDWLVPHRNLVLTDLESVATGFCVVNGTHEADWASVSQLCSGDLPPRSLMAKTSRLVLLPSFGLHPWHVGNRGADWQQALLAQLAQHPNASIGEIGLDRWIIDRARPDDSRLTGLRRASLEEQTEVFRWQLAVAAERNLPATIHCLEAFGALFDVLRSVPLPHRGFLLHAYSGSMELAQNFARLGAYFSFSGAFLESRKERLREMYRHLPADRLLVETDAPAMRLPPDREAFTLPPNADGTLLNHPANLSVTYNCLAQLRGVPIEPLRAQIAENFERLFLRNTIS